MPEHTSLNRTSLIVIFAIIVLAAIYVLYFHSSSDQHRAATQEGSLAKCLGFDQQGSWALLARPNSVWEPGLAIEFVKNQEEPNFLGKFIEQCLPGLDVNKVIGNSSPVSCNNAIELSAGLSTEFGLSEQAFVKAGITFGEEGQPQVVSSIRIEAAQESVLDLLQIENHLDQTRFDAMPSGCKLTLTDANRFVVAGTYRINAGTISVSHQDGAKIDISLPQYKKLRTAVARSGFAINSVGEIQITSDTEPLTVAVRAGDFGKVLASLGISRKGELDFVKRMRETGHAE